MEAQPRGPPPPPAHEPPAAAPEPGHAPLKDAMRQAMDRLEAKNAEYGGALATKVGVEGETAAYIFNTPFTHRPADESRSAVTYLVATEHGFKGIQAEIGPSSETTAESFIGYMDKRFELVREGKTGHASSSGYLRYNDATGDGTYLRIGAETVIRDDGESNLGGQVMREIKLLEDVHPALAKNIINQSKMHADIIQQKRLRQQEIEQQRAQNQVEIAQHLDSVLG